ncbi:MAG: hypothetical protein DSM107014_01065 [Gomphosphaeria aponina SAG 52.96 = DSM 107014]|uniref:Uncharacterized protein n=1 Tax=Gomphosphaeria aponina SAG 52.96 = DSM 107014 TaxID=1521640 RepID=A0A941GMN3_9CHRO|nr:hypothetical protein [Gomphosphaeria aponina SAG 52.96 = DSM 107014]
MYFQIRERVSNSEIYTVGDVTIHSEAIIAPGVILQAAPGSKIVIRSGACIGMGVILKAYQGTLTIESGVILGAGVLVVGFGTIGKNACVGTASTIFNASVDSMAVLSPGSLIGDTSRQVGELKEAENVNSVKEKVPPPTEEEGESDSFWEDHWIATEESVENLPGPSLEKGETKATAAVKSNPNQEETAIEAAELKTEVLKNGINSESSPEKGNTPAIGKVYINNLLVTLFPHRQPLNNQNQDS